MKLLLSSLKHNLLHWFGTLDELLYLFAHVLSCFRRRPWHPTPVLLPGKSHGQRSLAGCSPWGREELDTTKWLHFHFSFSCIGEGNGNPLQCSCLENPRDGRAWWAAIYGVAQSQTRLKWVGSSSSIKLLQSSLTVRNRMVCSPQGSSVHGILQAGIHKWLAMPFCRGSSPPRIQTWVSFIAGWSMSVPQRSCVVICHSPCKAILLLSL